MVGRSNEQLKERRLQQVAMAAASKAQERKKRAEVVSGKGKTEKEDKEARDMRMGEEFEREKEMKNVTRDLLGSNEVLQFRRHRPWLHYSLKDFFGSVSSVSTVVFGDDSARMDNTGAFRIEGWPDKHRALAKSPDITKVKLHSEVTTDMAEFTTNDSGKAPRVLNSSRRTKPAGIPVCYSRSGNYLGRLFYEELW
ncbi:hypothetical protein HPP92_021244 [Vanilla planifolia]|uniref:Uncharacterized protein n=1 Tax=Vanilla planifolia TaxID=51239 RepID=A0A835Q3V5_VANPL|nr:hypothetical protein HPP92_021244 [Vanilla planifolia]